MIVSELSLLIYEFKRSYGHLKYLIDWINIACSNHAVFQKFTAFFTVVFPLGITYTLYSLKSLLKSQKRRRIGCHQIFVVAATPYINSQECQATTRRN